MSDFPELEEKFINKIFETSDPYKKFMYNVFESIPYLSKMKPMLFHKLIYGFREEEFERDEIINRVDDLTDFIIIIASGQVEMFIECDNNEFVLERLGQGSVINHINFYFKEESFAVNVRCS